MTQTERRKYLIQELLREQPQYRNMEIPESAQDQKNLLRSLFNIRMPEPVSEEFLQVQDAYLQDEGWYAAAERYNDFLRRHKKDHVLYLELGVGANTPGIIKYPFWQMTARNKNAVYACLNFGEAFCPREIQKQAICIDGDIGEILDKLQH